MAGPGVGPEVPRQQQGGARRIEDGLRRPREEPPGQVLRQEALLRLHALQVSERMHKVGEKGCVCLPSIFKNIFFTSLLFAPRCFLLFLCPCIWCGSSLVASEVGGREGRGWLGWRLERDTRVRTCVHACVRACVCVCAALLLSCWHAMRARAHAHRPSPTRHDAPLQRTRCDVNVFVCVFVCVCRSIKPFDVAELPTHLKGCSTAKRKENFKECAQMAVEATGLSRREKKSDYQQGGKT